MKSRSSVRLAAVGAAVAVSLALAACSENKAAPPAPPPPTVFVAPVVRQDVPLFVEAVATLDGYVNADIRARVRGYLRTQDFKDGAPVKTGQLLFTIEPDEYAAASTSARANLERAHVARDHNRIQLDRDLGLFKTGMISQQDVDNQTAGLADTDGQTLAAEAQLRQAQLNLSYTQIRSPVDGESGFALVRVGNLVGQDGPTLLTTVSQVDPIRITFPLSEVDFVQARNRFKHLQGKDLRWVKEQLGKLDSGGLAEGGDPGIELVLSDGSVYAHRGVLVSTNREVDPSTGTIQLQALIGNPDGDLRPGQFGRVRVRKQDAGHDVLVVPDKALISVQGAFSVAVVGPDNKVSLKKVELGPSSHGLQIIEKGVSEGDRIVVEGVQKAAEGSLVDPKPVSAKDAPSPAASSASVKN
jgi:membrane fusion protein (multidrug efflux system)